MRVDFDSMCRLEIPAQNNLQTRIVLLTMLNSRLLSTREVSQALGLSAVHTLNLARRLDTDDVAALIDKREGQKQQYRFTAEVKAELIQQYVLDIASGGRASGKQLADTCSSAARWLCPSAVFAINWPNWGCRGTSGHCLSFCQV